MRYAIGSRILLIVTVIVAIGALGWLTTLSCQVYGPGGWEDEVYTLQGQNGTGRAMDDYGKGYLRMYRLGGEQ